MPESDQQLHAAVFVKARQAGYQPRLRQLCLLLLTVVIFASLPGCEQRGEVKPLWIVPLPFHFLESYTVAEGVILAFGADQEFYDQTEKLAGTLIALDSKSGSKLWQHPIEPARRYFQQGELEGGSFIVIAEGLAFYRDLNNVLHAVDIKSGSELWQAKDVIAILTRSAGQVFVVSAQKKLAALDVKNGAVQSVSDLPWKNEIVACTRMLIADGRQFLSVDGVLTVTDQASGKQLWSTESKSECIEMMSAPGFLVLASLGTFTVFDGASGKNLWHFTTTYDAKLPRIEGDIVYTDLDEDGEYNPSGGFTRGFKIGTGEKVVELKVTGPVAAGVLYDLERADHYDYASKIFVGDYHWADSSDVRLVAKDLKTGARLWTAEPWCWGWIEHRTTVDNMVYTPCAAQMGAEPTRLLAYRAGRGGR
ncbi:MAG TPA: PQQ-binding-like beta-propeller repeat protein [Pyrinomonadaceae bacterium]|jgi:outer membrane protein assembly factor BamB|nr:PQQ-binding-like beta-propeller repeat protein [Pyrinomonadaceae bacterium]